MMHTSRIALAALMAIIYSSLPADATVDLLAAIKAQNIQQVEAALKAGALVGTDIKACAFEHINLACQYPIPLLASCASLIPLIIASFMHNKKYALMSLAGCISGTALAKYNEKSSEKEANLLQKITSALYIEDIVEYAGTAGLVACAWASKQYVLSSIGTAGLAALYYQSYRLKIALEIYKMIDPTLVSLDLLA